MMNGARIVTFARHAIFDAAAVLLQIQCSSWLIIATIAHPSAAPGGATAIHQRTAMTPERFRSQL